MRETARRLSSVTILIAIALAATAALAGDDRKELTAFVGYRSGGSFTSFSTGRTFDVSSSETYGLVFDFPTSDETKIELLISHQPTDIETSGFTGRDEVPLEITYYHVGAIYQPSLDEKLQPFVGGTLGATYLKPDAPDSGSETEFSFSLGGGGKFFFGDHVGIRLEGRIYGTVISGSGAVFCGGGCTFGFSGDVLWQFEANAGLIIAF